MINVPSYCTHYFLIFKWQEFIEIILFATAFYYFSSWLLQDKTKKLVRTFLGLQGIFILAHMMDLTALSSAFFYFTPVMLMLFILAHQRMIQKNFVTATTIKPAHIESYSWLHDIIKTMVFCFSKDKDLLCMIEMNDYLGSYLTPTIPVQAPLSKQLLHALVTSPSMNYTQPIYITKNGTLAGINCTGNPLDELITEEEKAFILAQKTDAVYIKSSAHSRTLSMCIQGTISEHLTSVQALAILEAYCKQNKKKELSHELYQTNSSYKQPQP